jgi:hypothetical protein
MEAKLIVIQPYTDIGFDPLAIVISLDGSWYLEKLTGIAHMSCQGRPLYAFIFSVCLQLFTFQQDRIPVSTGVGFCQAGNYPVYGGETPQWGPFYRGALKGTGVGMFIATISHRIQFNQLYHSGNGEEAG